MLEKYKLFNQYITENIINKFKFLLNIKDTIFRQINPLNMSIFVNLISAEDFYNIFDPNLIKKIEENLEANYCNFYKEQYAYKIENIEDEISTMIDLKFNEFYFNTLKDVLLKRLKCDYDKQMEELTILKLAFNIIINSDKTKEYLNILNTTNTISNCKWIERISNSSPESKQKCLYKCYGEFCPFHFQ